MLQRIKHELKQGKTLITFSVLQAAGQILAMIVPLILAGFFSPELFGSYCLAKMIVFFFATLLISSSQTPFIVLANKERSKSGKINGSFSVQCVFLAASFCLFLAIVILFNKQLIAFAEINQGDLVFVLIAFVGLALKMFLCNLFMAMGHRTKNALAQLLFGVLLLCSVVVLYLTDKIGIRTVFSAYLVSSLIVVLVFVKTINFQQLFPFEIGKSYFKETFSFARWIMLGATAVYFINWGDNLVLKMYVPMSDIGAYNLAYQLFKGTLMLVFIVYTYFLPFVSEHIENPAKIRNYLSHKRLRLCIIGAICLGVLILIAPRLLSFVYKDAYENSAAVLRVLLIGSVVMLYAVFYHALLNAMKKYRIAQIANIVQVVLNLLLDLLLIPSMGIMGAAAGTVLAYVCHVIILESYFRLKCREIVAGGAVS